MGKMFKRITASVLALAMTFTMIQYRPLHVHALHTLTSADIISNNRDDIGLQELNVLLSGALTTDSFNYEVPTDSSLVKVDPDALTIEAATFTDDHGNVWVPELAYVSGQEEPYTLTDGKATFTAAGNQYSVKVTYRAYVEIATDEQERLLNAAYVLYDAKESLDKLLDTDSDLRLLAEQIPAAKTAMDASIALGEAIPEEFENAINALNAQVEEKGFFTFNALVDKYYDEFDAYVSYFYSEDVKTLRAEAIALSNLLVSIDAYNEYLPLEGSLLRKLADLIYDLAEGADDVYWAPLYTAEKPLVNVEADLTSLESIVSSRQFKNLDPYTATSAKLQLGEAVVEANVAMHEVEVTVTAITFDANGNAKPLTATTTLTVNDGATAKEIEAMVAEFKAEKLNQWNTALGLLNVNYNINLDNYEYAAIPNAEEVTALSITYTPKTFTFKVMDGETVVSTDEVKYGAFIELPKASEGEYEYLINGVNYKQGVSVRVLGNTEAIRSEGKAKVEGLTIFDVIAEDSYYGLNKITADILSNDALKSPVAEYRVLAEGDVTITLEEVTGGFLLTAPTYSAGVADMEWAPVAYSVNGSTEKVAMTGTTATINGLVENVKVFYELTITQNSSTGDIYDVNKNLESWINLPALLVEETKEQLAVLDRLAGMADPNSDSGYLSMGTLINTALGLLQDQYDDKNTGKYKHDDYTKYSEQDRKEYLAILEIKDKCFAGANLKIYNYINKYIELGDKGLAAYYGNENGYNQYKEQLDTLSKNLRTIVESDEFDNVKTNPDFSKFEDQINKVGDITTELESIELVKPNTMVDANHTDFGALLDLLQSEEANNVMSNINTENGLHAYYDEKVTNTDLYFTYNVVVNVNGTQYKDSITVLKHTNLTEANVAEITDIVNGFLAGVDTVHNTVGKYTLPTTSTNVGADTTLTVNVTANDYTIKYVDENGKKLSETTVQFGNRNETLTASDKTDLYYVYTANGNEYNTKDGNQTLYITTGNFDSLFVDGVLTITRITKYVSEEQLDELKDFVEKLNDSFKGKDTKVELVQAQGENKLVFALDAAESTTITDSLMSFAETLMKSDYKYIALGESDNVFYDALTPEINAQALINAFLHSGMTSADLAALFDGGKVNNNANDVIFGTSVFSRLFRAAPAENYGGLLLQSRIILKNQFGEDEHDLDFFITIKSEGANDAIAKIEKALDLVFNYVTFTTKTDESEKNPSLNLEVTLPNKGYEAVLAGMILLGYADLDDVNNAKFDKVVEFVVNEYDELINGKVELNAEVVQNTLDKLGIDKSVSKYAKYINYGIKALKHLTLDNDDETLVGNLEGDAYAVLSKVVPASYLSMLNSEIKIPATAKLTNKPNYDAIVLDLFNDDKKVYTRVDFSSNIETDVTKLADNSVVVLLNDAEELNVKENVVLDLNGNNVKAINVADNATLRIFDSSLTDGVVNAIEGKNITIVGGVYKPAATVFGLRSATNVETYLPEGYVQDDNGTVHHEFYTITETTDGIVIEVNPDVKAMSKQDIKDMDYKYLAAELGLTLGMRYFNTGSLTIDGYKVAELTEPFADLVDLYADATVLSFANDVVDLVNYKGIQEFVNNKLIPTLTNFAQMSANVKANGVIAEFDIVTCPMTLDVSLVKDSAGNYLTGGIAPNTLINRDETLMIKVGDNVKDYATDILDLLAEVLTIDPAQLKWTDVNIDKLNRSDIAASTDFAFNGKATVKFAVKHTILMATVLAYDNPSDTKLRDAIIAYICEGNTTLLKNAIEKYTVAQMHDAIVNATNKDVSFDTMFKTINAKLPADYQGAFKLEDDADAYLAFAMKLVRFLGVDDSGRKVVVDGDATRTFAGRVTLTLELDLVAENGAHKHTFTNYVFNNDATCTADGTETATCDICGNATDTRTAAGTATGHNHVLDQTTVKQPTCTEPGYTGDKVCTCGDKILGTAIDPTGHSFTNYVFNNDATCTTDGTETATCDNGCGATDTRTLAGSAKGHSFTNYVYNNDATCTTDGTETATCDNGCGETDTRTLAGSAKGHDTHVVGAFAPTCTKAGYTGDEVCKVCGTVVKPGVAIKATGHNYVNGVCTICGAKNPKTADNSFIEMYAVLAVVTLGAIVVLTKKREELLKK